MEDKTISAKRYLTSVSAFALLLSGAAYAQENNSANPDEGTEEIVVTGIRGSLRTSMQTKRKATTISDAMVSADIGDLPDISIGETLERISGVAGNRYKGSTQGISVRGLGEAMSSSTINGRNISSGSYGRGVNFAQFPSELVNGAIVYKTQQANFIEGGTSGVVELQTLRPIEYGKQRLTLEARGELWEYEQRINGGSPLGTRGTMSYIDQWETSGGKFGIAIGGQLSNSTAPEEIFGTSSTYRPCNDTSGSNCSYDPDSSEAVFFPANQYYFRQMTTNFDRNAVMANAQWQPNEQWDINLDVQYSSRSDEEIRNEFIIHDGRRKIVPLTVSPEGTLLEWEGESRIGPQTNGRTRDEVYKGAGLSVEWSDNENLTLEFDLAYNRTERRQSEKTARFRTNKRLFYYMNRIGTDVPHFEILEDSDFPDGFDMDDHDNYDNGRRAERKMETVDDDIFSARFDGEYTLGGGFLTALKAGARFSDRQRIRDDGMDTRWDGSKVSQSDYVPPFDTPSVVAARNDEFTQDDFMASTTSNVAGMTWATFDPYDLWDALTAPYADGGVPDGSTLSTHDTNVREKVLAGYLMADFESTLAGTPVRGNFGVRVVKTDVTSIGITQAFETTDNGDGTFNIDTVGDTLAGTVQNSFTDVLPSLNIIFDVRENFVFRAGVYKAISRPAMEQMTSALKVSSTDVTELGDAISASGNPNRLPLKSDNVDISLEWYVSDDTMFSVAHYYKKLRNGIETVGIPRTFSVDGSPQNVIISVAATSDETSDLAGVELSGQHIFTSLPGFLSGFGVKANYAYTYTNFETPDPTRKDGKNYLKDFTNPASLQGLSKHTGNATVFWEGDKLSLRLAYKFRSRFYRDSCTCNVIRYNSPQDFVDFSASYYITDNLQLKFQALNLSDEPNIYTRATFDNTAEVDYSGRKFLFGVKAKF